METERGRRTMTIVFVAAFICFVLAVLVAPMIRDHSPSGETPTVPRGKARVESGQDPQETPRTNTDDREVTRTHGPRESDHE